jgi:predicted enzyme related to lactoylglutathione lyase
LPPAAIFDPTLRSEGELMPGKLVHFEASAKDTSRALDFYSKMFGWQFQAFEGAGEYHMTQLAEDMGGAVTPGDPGAIRVYFDVDDINDGVARLKELGGKADDPMPVPGMGWFATAADTEGNPIGLWQTDPSASMPEG